MKIFVIFAAIIFIVNGLTILERWNDYKSKFNRTYRTIYEHEYRFAIFKSNIMNIDWHNILYRTGLESYSEGVNEFADLTQEEFADKYLSGLYLKSTNIRNVFRRAANASAVPDSIDWRQHGVVTSVKNQGQCGSCWAFSATGSLEGQYAIKYKQKVSLSEQELVDCSVSYGNYACWGGNVDSSFFYIRYNGISTDSYYPYKGEYGRCLSAPRSKIKLIGFSKVRGTQEALKQAVGTIGPISVYISGDFLQTYDGGIIKNFNCSGNTLNHVVLLIGYGRERGNDYWLLKNSWGTNWGEQGYFRVIRNTLNDCGLHEFAFFPIIA